MIDDLANLLALRALAIALPAVATTGPATLEATADGYARATGSFVDDGFTVGMEVVPNGFADTTPGVVTSVAALALGIDGGRAVEAPGAARELTCALPSLRAWEGVEFSPVQGRWYVEEEYVPGPARVQTIGQRAQIECDPMYFLKLYSPPGRGVAAPYRLANALLTAFAPQTALLLTTGDVLRVRGDPAPYRGQLVNTKAGFALVVVTIPLRLRTANSI